MEKSETCRKYFSAYSLINCKKYIFSKQPKAGYSIFRDNVSSKINPGLGPEPGLILDTIFLRRGQS